MKKHITLYALLFVSSTILSMDEKLAVSSADNSPPTSPRYSTKLHDSSLTQKEILELLAKSPSLN